MQITQFTSFEQLMSPAGESSSSDGEFVNLLGGISSESEARATLGKEPAVRQDLEMVGEPPQHFAAEVKDRFGQKVALPVASSEVVIRGEPAASEPVGEEAAEPTIPLGDTDVAVPAAGGEVSMEEGGAAPLPIAPEKAIEDGSLNKPAEPSLVESEAPEMSSNPQGGGEPRSSGSEALGRKEVGEAFPETGKQAEATSEQNEVARGVSVATAGSENVDADLAASLAEVPHQSPISAAASSVLSPAAVDGRQTSLTAMAVPDERTAQAMQTLRKIDKVEGILLNDDPEIEGPLPEAEIVEAEIVEPEEVRRAVEGERFVRAQSGSTEQSFTPLNLGKPIFSMAAHELLQGSVSDRQAAPAAQFVNLAPAAASMTAPVGAGHASPHMLHQVVLATSTQRLAQDVGSELVRDIRSGKSELLIRLDPAELGRIEIKMTFTEEGRIRAVFAVDNPQTAELLRRDADSLLRSLTDAGINAEADDLQFDMREGMNPGDERDENSSELASGESRGESSETDDVSKPSTVMRGRLV